jgi:menaquinone-dependent protoporphyrinogen oxidase
MRLAIIYATRYGHSAKVAEAIASAAAREHVQSAALDVRRLSRPFDFDDYDGVVLVGGVHFGRYARPLERFVVRNLAPLTGMRSAFVSISGSAISEEGLPAAEACIDQFVRRTGWVPDRRASFGGAISYTKYGFIIRTIMKRISQKHGRSTDTSRDHDYTNWPAVDAFVRDFIGEVVSVSSSSAIAAALA